MGIKPMGRNTVKPLGLSSALVGQCTECKRGIYSDQGHAQVRSPSTGKNHTWCVPECAVVLKWVTP